MRDNQPLRMQAFSTRVLITLAMFWQNKKNKKNKKDKKNKKKKNMRA